MILKGTRVGITGEIINRPYQTKEGIEKTSLECRVSDVTLLGSKSGESVNTQQSSSKTDEQKYDDYDKDPF